MSQIIVTRNISQTSKLGHRLIKFRYGVHKQQESQPSAGTQHAASTTSKARSTGEAIWDFQIPARWRRAPLSEEECAVINNGGPL